jgi:hypothetical protein
MNRRITLARGEALQFVEQFAVRDPMQRRKKVCRHHETVLPSSFLTASARVRRGCDL